MIDDFVGKYRFLSNFYPDNDSTVEHYYQAAKTNNASWAASIMMASTPGEAKKLGRNCPLRHNWEEIKDGVMFGLLLNKFFDDEYLANALLDTGNEELMEGNTWGDTYWGVCRGVGQNKLGKMLMEIRDLLYAYEHKILI